MLGRTSHLRCYLEKQMDEDISNVLTEEEQRAIKARLASIPIFQTLNYRCDRIGKGEAVFTFAYERKWSGIFESFHGGMMMTLADSAASVAVLSLVGADAITTTTDMNIRFLAPCLTDLTAHAKVIKFGATLCPVAVELRDANGTLVAIAQVTYMRLSKMPKRQA